MLEYEVKAQEDRDDGGAAGDDQGQVMEGQRACDFDLGGWEDCWQAMLASRRRRMGVGHGTGGS